MGGIDQECKKLTPPQLARRFGVGPDKVLAWIRSGELPAINGAAKPNGRPRYLIDKADVEAFEAQRQVRPKKLIPASIRHRKPSDTIKFF
jgi:excisionase family DNA binding protein